MESFTSLAEQRHSARQYTEQPVEKEKIMQIVEACRLAPSAHNSQPWKLTIIDEPELKLKVAKATTDPGVRFNKFAVEAPVIAVLTLEKPKLISRLGSQVKNIEYSLIDVGIFAEHFCLKATELGLGTCMLGWFHEEKVKSLLNIPKKKRVPLLITLGYQPEGYIPKKKSRKSTEEICSFNAY